MNDSAGCTDSKLTADGQAALKGLNALKDQENAWWGNELSDEEAMAILLRFELSTVWQKMKVLPIFQTLFEKL